MKPQKIFAIALACAVTCSLFSACGDKHATIDPGKHTHRWSEWTVTKAPSCETAGEERRVCKDNAEHFETRPVAALGHKWSKEWTKDETTHYHACERGCGQRSDEAEHSLHDLTCGVCGYSLASSALTYEPIEDGSGKTVAYAVSGWAESEKDRSRLVIPASHENKPVTSVGTQAFYAEEDTPDTTLEEVLLPSTVIDIGENAFTHCQALNKIELENIVSIRTAAFWDTAIAEADLSAATLVESYAFYGDVALTDVTLGDGLSQFGKKAFYGTSIERLSLGKAFSMQIEDFLSTTLFDDSPFPATLEEISVSPENPLYTCKGNVVYDKNVSEILCVPFSAKGSIKIENGVTAIAGTLMQFRLHTNITSLTIPSSVTAIDSDFDAAFSDCVRLAEIFNGSGIDLLAEKRGENLYGINDWTVVRTDLNGKSILTQDQEGYVWATGDETKLVAYFGGETELTLPMSHAGARYSISGNAFYQSNLKKAVVSGGVREIGENSFRESASLKEVVLEEGVETIAKSAFYACAELTRLSLPLSLKSMGAGAVAFCTALEKVIYPGDVSDFAAIQFAHSLWRANDTLTLELAGTPLPETIVIENDIAGAAFEQCPTVKTVILRGVKVIEQNAFVDMPNLERVVMGREIENFRYAFDVDELHVIDLFFEGNADEWEAILAQHNNRFTADAFTVYFYANDPPAGSGQYWHYAEDLPVKWE